MLEFHKWVNCRTRRLKELADSMEWCGSCVATRREMVSEGNVDKDIEPTTFCGFDHDLPMHTFVGGQAALAARMDFNWDPGGTGPYHFNWDPGCGQPATSGLGCGVVAPLPL
jgi:hypothetical protein